MTNIDRAIAFFHEQSCKPTTWDELRFNTMAIEALRKTRPTLVNHERGFWTYVHYCPTCAERVNIEGLKYCNSCGQHLDWSNYKKGSNNVR